MNRLRRKTKGIKTEKPGINFQAFFELLEQESNLHEAVSLCTSCQSIRLTTDAGFIPCSSPPRQEGMSANFITQQCVTAFAICINQSCWRRIRTYTRRLVFVPVVHPKTTTDPRFIPCSSPPRREGMSANFITQQYAIASAFVVQM